MKTKNTLPIVPHPISLFTSFSRGMLRLSTGISYQLRSKRADVADYQIRKLAESLIILQPVSETKWRKESLENTLWEFLLKDQLPILKQRLDDLAEGWIEERCHMVRLRGSVKSRWGSCDKRRRVIMLAAKLLLLPSRLLDYVCIHELAHLKYSDHSDLFWALVSKKMPDWKVQRKRLRAYEEKPNFENIL